MELTYPRRAVNKRSRQSARKEQIRPSRAPADGRSRVRIRRRRGCQRRVRGSACSSVPSPAPCCAPWRRGCRTSPTTRARPVERLIRRLALQNPSRVSKRRQHVDSCRTRSRARPDRGGTLIQVARTQAPSLDLVVTVEDADLPRIDCGGSPPKISAARSRSGAACSVLVRNASSVSQALVAMHRPDSRSTNSDRPTYPSMACKRGHDLVANIRNSGVDQDGCA